MIGNKNLRIAAMLFGVLPWITTLAAAAAQVYMIRRGVASMTQHGGTTYAHGMFCYSICSVAAFVYTDYPRSSQKGCQLIIDARYRISSVSPALAASFLPRCPRPGAAQQDFSQLVAISIQKRMIRHGNWGWPIFCTNQHPTPLYATRLLY